MAVNAVSLKGVTTLVWGTLGVLGSPAGCIVESIRVTPRNASFIGEVENGDGAVVMAALLVDGFSAQVEVAYDTAKTWPAEGDPVVLTIGKTGAAGGTVAANCCLVSYGQSYMRKKEMMISINLESRPGITFAWKADEGLRMKDQVSDLR